jgi:hypothetical protein
MKTIKSISGYTWAILSFLIILLLFPALQPLSREISKFPFMKINPIYSGGDRNFEIEGKGYILTVNKPVFEALIGTSNEGFVQMTWVGDFSLPHADTIDFNKDKSSDFVVKFFNTKKPPQIEPLNNKVKALQNYAKTKTGWIVRVGLLK